jgi:hypothetical protein
VKIKLPQVEISGEDLSSREINSPGVPPPHVVHVLVLWLVAWVTNSCPTDVLVAVKPKMAAIGQNNARDVASMGFTLLFRVQAMILCSIPRNLT